MKDCFILSFHSGNQVLQLLPTVAESSNLYEFKTIVQYDIKLVIGHLNSNKINISCDLVID